MIVVYDAPKGAVLQKDYTLRVREEGSGTWKKVPIYHVRVDMHDVKAASMAYFDFKGKVEVELSGPYYIYCVDIRPLSMEIIPDCDTKKVRFSLDKKANLSIEVNKDRGHNLHLFAGEIPGDVPAPEDENVLVVKGNPQKPGTTLGADTVRKLQEMKPSRVLYVTAGVHYVSEMIFRIPSDTTVYLEGGAIVIGSFVCERVENVTVCGHGIIYQADFARFSSVDGVRISHSKNVKIADVIFINPPHYTVEIGESENIDIFDVKSFSCEGWSDGIDVMSSKNVHVKGGFLRTSDDCVAIYGSRWDYHGDSRDILVEGITLWADVAHPLMMGTHGDHERNGDVLENIRFYDIDILEHNEYQAGYLGCMAINVGDKNVARNITYENIRVEPFLHGKLFDVQVRFNPDYNPAPGKGIQNVLFKDIYYNGEKEETSCIEGYNEEFVVEQVLFDNIVIGGKKVLSAKEANIVVGKYARGICFVQ